MTARPSRMSDVSAIVDLCVIGGGEAGFSAALAGTALGLRVALVTASAADPCRRNWDVALTVLREAGLRAKRSVGGPDLGTALEAATTPAAPDRRFARLRALNVRVVVGRARFTGPAAIDVAGEAIRARRFVIAVGAGPVGGLASSDTVLDRLRRPDLPLQAGIVGSDPRSVALAQGLARLGVSVDLLAPEGLLPGLDPELLAPLRSALLADGVRIGGADEASAHPIIHAAGTIPRLADLSLDRAGIAVQDGRLALSAALRTSNRRVYAIGAAAGAFSSHGTQAQVATAMRSAFFRLPSRFDPGLVPLVVTTDPEIATVGLSEAEAAARGRLTVLRWPLGETARGGADRTPGHVKVVADARGRVLGAGIAGPAAAEGIAFWTLAVRSGETLQRLGDVALPAPSFSEASRRLIVQHAAGRLRSPLVKRTLTLLGLLG